MVEANGHIVVLDDYLCPFLHLHLLVHTLSQDLLRKICAFCTCLLVTIVPSAKQINSIQSVVSTSVLVFLYLGDDLQESEPRER